MYMLRDTLPNLQGKIRFIHAHPTAPNVDLYADGTLVQSNLSFGDLTNYKLLPPGDYTIYLYKTGTYDTPLFSEKITVLPRTISTYSIVTNNSENLLFKLKDSGSKASPDISFIRFINLSSNSPLLSLSLNNGDVLFNQVEYLETTGYYPLSPGIYDFNINFSGANFMTKKISDLTLVPGDFHTIYVVGLLKGEPQLGYILSSDSRE